MNDPSFRRPGIILRCDADGGIREVIRDDLGLTSAFALGQPFPALMAEADLPKVLDFLAALRRSAAEVSWPMAARLPERLAALRLNGYRIEKELLLTATLASEEAAAPLPARPPHHPGGRRKANGPAARLNNGYIGLQRELARRNTRLEQANERTGYLLGMAAHDLRTPLNIIGGFAEFIGLTAADRLTGQERDYLQLIHDHIRHMSGLIDAVMQLSAMESGHLRLVPAPGDLAALVRHVVRLEGELARRRGILIDGPAGQDAVILDFDADRIRQVLHNLIGNAVKYSPDGTRIAVTLTPGNFRVAVAVADQGVGIDEAEIGRLFQPFARTSSLSQDGTPSTGLGLFISRGIVEAHGGQIAVESRKGAGATFTIVLPRKRDEAETARPKAAGHAKG